MHDIGDFGIVIWTLPAEHSIPELSRIEIDVMVTCESPSVNLFISDSI